MTVQKSSNLDSWLIERRRHLHQHPELSFHEKETSAFVEKELQKLDVSILKTHVGGHYGIVAQIDGKNKDYIVGLRGDMDALPIQEEWPSDIQSKTPRVSHMCGHDSHTTMLLGAVKILSEQKDQLPHSVRFFFQHAEEKVPGGAIDFVNEGWLDDVNEIYGIHVDPQNDLGKIRSRPGNFLAHAAEFDIMMKGVGGHAALPHRTNDLVIATAHTISSLQSIIPRQLDPLKEAVMSITKIHGGDANNVIPERVEFGGTLRVYEEDQLIEMQKLIRRHLEGTCTAFGCEYEATFEEGYPALVNHQEGFDKLQKVVTENLPDLKFETAEPIMAGEDFARFLQVKTGCFFFIGCAHPDDPDRYNLHHPKFHLDEAVLPLGARVLAEVGIADLIDR